ncbi:MULTISPECIES: GGDEF domain-containing protein [Vibrio]|uniref:diguanylate cyclase n=2 Tax=Vibrio TaxID=662 RepID=A0A7X4LM79_9VIBR|nr:MULTISPECIES: sensor domain-containing diguanylate cyclase [Vibrio]MBF9002994.1 diguanylate cyclase [Vibrio nitrifigilis]MZI94563.1 diguanylate cyclase [Vibrio eleionomae]
MSIVDWYKSSLSHRIGSLFMLLLATLLCVISFSIYKLKVIDSEMKEVAYIDVPLNQIMGRIEMLQLEQHILFEQFKLKQNHGKLTPDQEYAYQKQQLKQLLDQAVSLIMDNLEKNHIRFAKGQHRQLLKQIEQFQEKSEQFEVKLGNVLRHHQSTIQEKKQLEQLALSLEHSVKDISDELQKLTAHTSQYTEKHEREFFWINIALGVCATVLGLLLTYYIVRFFQRRIRRMQGSLKQLEHSLTIETQLPKPEMQPAMDELSELELDLKQMMLRLADEIENREQVEKQLLKLATRDKLTGAYNRHKWDEQLAMHVELGRRGAPFSILIMDIDFFKKINDTFGHLAGDKVLQHLPTVISESLRSTDQLFRIGGEEFAVILPMQNGQAGCQVAERIRKSIEASEKDDLPHYTVSVGVSEFELSDDRKSLFTRADKALYAAKRRGRNQVVLQ